MIYHTVKYTVYSAEARAHYESSTALYRQYPLTCTGAQRILRKELDRPTLNVVRIEKMHVQK